MTRGPSKGHGGRPRKPGGSVLKSGPKKGYVKKTVGPKGKGTQKYAHQVAAGTTKSGKNTVVHHKDGSRGNNSRKNLEVTSRKRHPKVHK